MIFSLQFLLLSRDFLALCNNFRKLIPGNLCCATMFENFYLEMMQRAPVACSIVENAATPCFHIDGYFIFISF